MAKENKTMDEIHRGLLKKYHTLCTVLGLDDEAKRAILTSWGVESSRDLTQHQLIDICGKLSAQVDEKQGTARLDKLRKQVIAAIGGWLRETGQKQSLSIIKGIAMRASGYADFNKIPRERLRNLIATFNNKVKDARAVDALTDALLMQHYAAGGVVVSVALPDRDREVGNARHVAHCRRVLRRGTEALNVFQYLVVSVICCRDGVHEAGEIVTAQPLHGGVDRVKQVETCESFLHCRILRTVYSGRGTVEDMQPDIDVGTPGVVVLLMPFDSLKFHEHRRERIDGTACKMRAVIIPEIHVSNAGDGKEFFGYSCKNLFPHCLKKSVS